MSYQFSPTSPREVLQYYSDDEITLNTPTISNNSSKILITKTIVTTIQPHLEQFPNLGYKLEENKTIELDEFVYMIGEIMDKYFAESSNPLQKATSNPLSL